MWLVWCRQLLIMTEVGALWADRQGSTCSIDSGCTSKIPIKRWYFIESIWYIRGFIDEMRLWSLITSVQWILASYHKSILSEIFRLNFCAINENETHVLLVEVCGWTNQDSATGLSVSALHRKFKFVRRVMTKSTLVIPYVQLAMIDMCRWAKRQFSI